MINYKPNRFKLYVKIERISSLFLFPLSLYSCIRRSTPHAEDLIRFGIIKDANTFQLKRG